MDSSDPWGEAAQKEEEITTIQSFLLESGMCEVKVHGCSCCETSEGNNIMKRNLVEVYALAVCFVTLVCCVVALGFGIYDLIRIANPEFTLNSHQYERHQSNESFSSNWPQNKPVPEDEKLTKLREDSYRALLRTEKRDGVQSLAWSLIIILIDIIVFAIHWLMAKRARFMAEID